MSIDFYKELGEFGFLANYSQHGFFKKGIYYPTAEHYYQSQKFDDVAIRNRIIKAKTPKEASNIGRDRALVRRNNFRDIKNFVMYEGVLEKFRQNFDIRDKLIETRNEEIREMTVKESYWGVGPNFDGENHMGKILMKVRKQIKEEILDQILVNCRDRKVYIIGHSNPDLDSVFASIILKHVLEDYGIEAVVAVRDENFVNKEFIFDYLDEEYVVIDDYSNKYFLLVDHNSLDGIPSDCVVGAIDHHILTGEVRDIIEIEYASCGLLIYDLFCKRHSFTKKDKKLVALTVLSDTEYFTSSRYSEEDKKLYSQLGISLDVEKLQKKYFKTTDFSNSIVDNFYKNYKEYYYDDVLVRRSLISSYLLDRKKYYDKYVLCASKESIDLLIWCDYEEKKTYIWYKDLEYQFPYFTTSTYLVLESLKDKKAL